MRAARAATSHARRALGPQAAPRHGHRHMNADANALDPHLFPQAIVNHQVSGVLELRWQDGSESRLPHGLLRARCRCAGCEQSWRAQGTPVSYTHLTLPTKRIV